MDTFCAHVVTSCIDAPKTDTLCRQIEESSLLCRGVYTDELYEHIATQTFCGQIFLLPFIIVNVFLTILYYDLSMHMYLYNLVSIYSVIPSTCTREMYIKCNKSI